MAYTALYRKFRPAGFEEVKGQEHIVTTLKNQICAERIGHAYLFCGTRGTGKTTVAKILAKAVNCEKPTAGSPCGECAMCRAISSGTSLNVIEIDAASNNGVDNIREIIEEVQYSPTEGKYKVYIIDEVHMLSQGAFNALLKTLEEPPSFAIFILATTEAHKIPVTILSRCQRYDFKRISIDTIADRLADLMGRENTDTEEKALRYIAKAADGSMRDALSLLDQCTAFYFGKRLTYDNVLEVLGAVDIEVFGRLFRHISSGQMEECLELLDKIILSGRDISQFTVDFTWYFRNLLLLKASKDGAERIEVSDDQLRQLRGDAKLADAETLMRYIRIFSDLSGQLKYAGQKRILLEISLMKLCRPEMETDYSSLVQRVKQLEKQIQEGAALQSRQEHRKTQEVPEIQQENEDIPVLLKAVPEDLKEVARHWTAIVNSLSPLLRTLVREAKPSIGADGALLLVFTDDMGKAGVEKEGHITEIKDAIAAKIQKEVEIHVVYQENPENAARNFPDLTKVIKMDIEYID